MVLIEKEVPNLVLVLADIVISACRIILMCGHGKDQLLMTNRPGYRSNLFNRNGQKVVSNAEFYADFRNAILTKIRSAVFSQIDFKVRHRHVPDRKCRRGKKITDTILILNIYIFQLLLHINTTINKVIQIVVLI